MIDFIKKEDKVLVVINKKVNESDVQQLLKEVNNDGVQIIKSVDLKKAVFEPSTFNSILTFDVLDSEDIIKLLNASKPGGSIIIHKLINNSEGNEAESLFSSDISSLRLGGFRYKECKVNSITSKWKIKGLLADDYQDDEVICQIVGERPSYELGSSVALSFAKKPQATNVWKLDDAVENDLIDEDDLLEADDFAKPDKSSLRVCGTTGKRKACKDCSCGLKEELNALETNRTPTTVKSSCGSCYLGDAFRCASCPYLGMPAFKPGEKVVLANSQLADDK